MAASITLPDFAAQWPFKRTQNPHFNESICKAHDEWMTNLNLLHGKAKAAFDGCNFPLFVSLLYPRANPILLRLSMDFIDWCFFLDELADPSDCASYRKLTVGVMEVLKDPKKTRPEGFTGIERLTQSFWSRCLEVADPITAKRFVARMQKDLDAICQEADDRAQGRVRAIEDYLALRRYTSGIEPCLHMALLWKGLPDEIWNHPRIQDLNIGCLDLIILSNDVYSYNFERSRGIDDHNMVTAVMTEKGLDIQDAINYIEQRYNEVAKRFLEDMVNVPSFSETLDPLVSEYTQGLGNAVRAFLEWAFESKRYFGSKGPEIRLTRVVELLPRSMGGDSSRESWSAGI